MNVLDEARRLLCEITDDDCNMRHWPQRTVAEFLAEYRERVLAEARAEEALCESKKAHGHGRD